MEPGNGTPACELIQDQAFLDPVHELIEICCLDNPEVVEGAPCSIQIFTSRMRDEECLEVAEVVDACLRRPVH
jgi:hypothetical protein